MARSNVSNPAEELQARLELPTGIEPWCLSVTLTRAGSMEWVQETEGEEVKMRVIGNSFKG